MPLPIPRVTATPFMLPNNTTMQDIEQIAAIGAEGVGLYLGRIDADGVSDDDVRRSLRDHGVRAAFVLPDVWTILPPPDYFGRVAAERDPRARVDGIIEAIERIAAFDPVAMMIGAGASGDPDNPVGPADAVEEGIARIADAAAVHGLTVSYEMLAKRIGAPLATFQETLAMLDRIDRPNVRLATDIWHIAEYPDVCEQLTANAHRLVVIDVCDLKTNERSAFDRELPGLGQGLAPKMIAALLEGGFEGWFKLEIFSDNGTYGDHFEDSYWDLPHAELLRMTREAFDESYTAAQKLAAAT